MLTTSPKGTHSKPGKLELIFQSFFLEVEHTNLYKLDPHIKKNTIFQTTTTPSKIFRRYVMLGLREGIHPTNIYIYIYIQVNQSSSVHLNAHLRPFSRSRQVSSIWPSAPLLWKPQMSIDPTGKELAGIFFGEWPDAKKNLGCIGCHNHPTSSCTC